MIPPLSPDTPPRLDLPGGPLTVTTVGMAVADLHATMEEYWQVLGWGPWKVYRQGPPALTDMRYRGQPAEFSFLVAGTQTPGGFSFWLCQPLEGPSVYRDLVEQEVPGPHFLAVWRETTEESAAVRAFYAERGAVEVMSARLPGSIEFTFIDARSVCGMILETGSGRATDQPLDSTYP
jgi:methylmalonyl-CoA/ethylmalonyl-CoA epimerase